MRFIKLAIISFVLIFGVATLLSFLLPSRVVVSRAIDIDAPKDTILKRVHDIKEWKSWLVNNDSIPMVVAVVNGRQLLTMGNTTVYISSVTSDEIKTNWRVKKGKTMPGYLNLSTSPDKSSVTVHWQFVQELNWYPWEKFSAIMSDKILSPFMEESLAKLKQEVEGNK